jgi:hypothetical protein
LFFCCSCAGSDASKLDVVRLEFGRGAEVNLEFVETDANVLNRALHQRLALRGLICRRRPTSPGRILNRRHATGHSSEYVHKLGEVLDLIGYAGRALRSHLRDILLGRRRRLLLPARGAVARL